jgi:hypothetical protein
MASAGSGAEVGDALTTAMGPSPRRFPKRMTNTPDVARGVTVVTDIHQEPWENSTVGRELGRSR